MKKKKIKIVEWPHYHEASLSVVRILGWKVKIRKHMNYVKDDVKVIDKHEFSIYLN